MVLGFEQGMETDSALKQGLEVVVAFEIDPFADIPRMFSGHKYQNDIPKLYHC